MFLLLLLLWFMCRQTVYVLDLSMVLASLLADIYKPYLGVKGEVVYIRSHNVHTFTRTHAHTYTI